jgi:hypothetical protein
MKCNAYEFITRQKRPFKQHTMLLLVYQLLKAIVFSRCTRNGLCPQNVPSRRCLGGHRPQGPLPRPPRTGNTRIFDRGTVGEIYQKLSKKAPNDREVGEIYQNCLNFQRSISLNKYVSYMSGFFNS